MGTVTVVSQAHFHVNSSLLLIKWKVVNHGRGAKSEDMKYAEDNKINNKKSRWREFYQRTCFHYCANIVSAEVLREALIKDQNQTYSNIEAIVDQLGGLKMIVQNFQIDSPILFHRAEKKALRRFRSGNLGIIESCLLL